MLNHKKSQRKALKTPQVVFKRVPINYLTKLVVDRLNGDYLAHEVMDILDEVGYCIAQILAEGYSYRLKGLGVFDLRTQKPRKYFNVNKNQWYWTEASYRPVFDFEQLTSRHIKQDVKLLMQETLHQGRDYPIEDQKLPDAEYLARLKIKYKGRLDRFKAKVEASITDLDTVETIAEKMEHVVRFEKKLNTRYDLIKQDIVNRHQKELENDRSD